MFAAINTTTPLISLIGCGNLGGAMLRGWLASQLPYHYAVLKPNDMPPDLRLPIITHMRTPSDIAPFLACSSAVILAVKPQIMDSVTQSLAPFMPKDVLILSIAAGRSIASFETVFGSQQPVIRTIPNLGAQARQSITPCVHNTNVNGSHKNLGEQLLGAIGSFDWIANEDLMHAAAALTASGPGFLAHFMETLEAAAHDAGFDKATSQKYIVDMVAGTAAYLKANPGLSTARLREQVTSPKGMTAAGLEIMMAEQPRLTLDTIRAATAKSRDLGQ
jgi:pyrroline-5-carboxylate reductase